MFAVLGSGFVLLLLCTAYCALAELYLTDLCFEEDAEQSCQAALDQSMQYNTTNNHEPVQGLASLRAIVGLDVFHNPAIQNIDNAFDVWLQKGAGVQHFHDLRCIIAADLLHASYFRNHGRHLAYAQKVLWQ